MQLFNLALSNFRLFRKAEITFKKPLTLLIGDNAQGKTTILEAIYLFATFGSPQTSIVRQMINFSTLEAAQPVSRLVAKFQRGDKTHTMEIRLIVDQSNSEKARVRKEIFLDGIKKTAAHAIGAFNAVIFLPQMTSLLERGPDERRKFLDQMIAQTDPGYAHALIDFNHALLRRNALLKNLKENGGDQTQLDYWDALLTENGSILFAKRYATLMRLEIIAAQKHKELSANLETLQSAYLPGMSEAWNESNTAPSSQSISKIPFDTYSPELLKKNRRHDMARGMTMLGPHRDEVRFFINGVDVGTYGSRGQIRTAVLALKMAEVEFIRENTNQWPVLLLDETIAELDPVRRDTLFSVIAKCEQGIITTTDLALFPPHFIEMCESKSLVDGEIILS